MSYLTNKSKMLDDDISNFIYHLNWSCKGIKQELGDHAYQTICGGTSDYFVDNLEASLKDQLDSGYGQ